jgi:hypothetical protein
LVFGFAVVLSPLPIALLAVYRQHVPLDRTPSDPVAIDLRAGSFRGVRLGEKISRARAVLGQPQSTDLTDSSHVWLDYGRQHLSVIYDHNRINDLVIDNLNAETALGLSIGDNAAIARRRYPEIFCNHDDDFGDSECAGLFGRTAVFSGATRSSNRTVARHLLAHPGRS